MGLLRWLAHRRSKSPPEPKNGHDERIQRSQQRQEQQARRLRALRQERDVIQRPK
jgi:hypothetical protein